MIDAGISKAYIDERERGVGRRMIDTESDNPTGVAKAVMPKTAARAKKWGRGVLPTPQQKQATGIAALTAGGGYAGTKYQQYRNAGPDTLPPAFVRASNVVKGLVVAPGQAFSGARKITRTTRSATTRPTRQAPDLVGPRAGTGDYDTTMDLFRRTRGSKTVREMQGRGAGGSAYTSARSSFNDAMNAKPPNYVGKAQRTTDPEYDRARRRGVLQGAATGAAIPLGMIGAKTFQTVNEADMNGGRPRTWKGRGIGVRSTPTGRFPRGRAGALGASGVLLGGAALSQRRGTKERNQRWT
jgi:hypothetical protein